HWLSTSLEAREFYVRVLGLSASLYSYSSEMQTGEADRIPPRPALLAGRFKWMFTLMALAAAVALVVWLRPARRTPSIAQTPTTNAANEPEFVARLTGSKEGQWVNPASAIPPGG